MKKNTDIIILPFGTTIDKRAKIANAYNSFSPLYFHAHKRHSHPRVSIINYIVREEHAGVKSRGCHNVISLNIDEVFVLSK